MTQHDNASPFGRRSFLAGLIASGGLYVVNAATGGVPAFNSRTQTEGRYVFSNGVASGDPTSRSVVLWTRALDSFDPKAVITLRAEISTSPSFERLTAAAEVVAHPNFDHTVRLLVDQLSARTVYYYRFVAADNISSIVGRTQTAPAPDDPHPFTFALVACQNYQTGYFTGYRRMRLDDEKAAPADQLSLVVHVGDFIYEAIYESAWGARPGKGPGIGPNDRAIPPFPSGGGAGEGFRYATTLDDYRHLYRHYLSDPDLIAARARWPFIYTWDDHEFSNDSWQSHDTYSAGGAAVPGRKLAANQAWFEYLPALLSGGGAILGENHTAHDFQKPNSVASEKISPEAVGYKSMDTEPGNAAAIQSMRIYRKLHYGALGEFIVTDTRSYRSDHALPETAARELLGENSTGRQALPVPLIEICDAGKTFNDGSPPETLTYNGKSIPNPRRNSLPGSMLGAAQKKWWKSCIAESGSRWIFWVNSVPAMPLRFNFSEIDPAQSDIVMSADSWEGYPSERRELLEFAAARGKTNLISLAGDYHTNLVGVLKADFAADHAKTLGFEIAVGGLSSTSIQEVFTVFGGDSFSPLVSASAANAEADPLNVLNLTFLKGVNAAYDFQKNRDLRIATIEQPRTSRHLSYVDTGAYGYAKVEVSEKDIKVELVQTERPVKYFDYEKYSDIRTGVSFEFLSSPASLSRPKFSGKKPFPYDSEAG